MPRRSAISLFDRPSDEQLHDLALALGQLAAALAARRVRPAGCGTRLDASAVSITVRPLRTAASAAWMPGPTWSRSTTPRAPAARAGATCAGSPTTATTGIGSARSSASRASVLLGVDARVPQRDLRAVALDDVDRAELREQARQPGAQQRIVGEQRDLDRVGDRGDGKVWIAGHGSFRRRRQS